MTDEDLILAGAVLVAQIASLDWLTTARCFELGAACTSLLTVRLMGAKLWWAPAVGLCSSCVWLGYIYTDAAFGLLISVLPMAWQHYQNLQQWRRPA